VKLVLLGGMKRCHFSLVFSWRNNHF